MPHRLTNRMKRERAAVCDLRLHGSALIRKLGFDLDAADVWQAAALGRYHGYPVNIRKVCELTGLDKTTAARKLHWLQETGRIVEVQSGNQRLQVVPDEVLFDDAVVTYFAERIPKIVNTASILNMRG